MTEEFSPPGEGWVEGQPGPADGSADWSGYEVVHHQANNVRRWWHRRIVPPLPTEPGYYYVTPTGWVWRLDSIGRWSNAETGGSLSPEYAASVGPLTRLVPEDEHRRQVAQQILDALDRDEWGHAETTIRTFLD